MKVKVALPLCNMTKLIIPPGSRFGKLTAIRDGKTLRLPSGQTNRTIRCKCDCGKIKNIRLLHLVRGRISSCGCMGGETHKMSGTKLYRVWTAMKERCYREGYIDQHRYKDRGIKMHKPWVHSFITFKEFALSNGWRPGLQIDRINNNDNYSPDNCRFVTNVINVNNRENTILITYNSKKISLSLLLLDQGKLKNYRAIYGRIKRGWNEQEAVDVPIKKGNYGKKKNRFTTEIISQSSNSIQPLGSQSRPE